MSIYSISPWEIAMLNFKKRIHIYEPIADRIIVATTKVKGSVLITRDQKMLDWAKLGHIKFIGG